MANDSNGTHTSMPYQAIIVLCLVGAGAAVLCAYALFRHFYEPEHVPAYDRENTLGADGLTQAQYMRTVRLRNQEELQQKYGRFSGYIRPQPAPVPQSSVSSYY